ncbi:phage tail tube protein [Sphingomonas nostoxanthinifaciens]|uniref:phage tail tube protein n=1 Tax=Sphingomonas nostoxanthinifaciens TaxID=2872652 RepID=UPI001CC21BEF|nr:phage tail tube protein [Sphingomonas nostoxanthinifaciens]UAK23669.1 phage tail protein [Sphingomonas nostoxanthinifaciens]
MAKGLGNNYLLWVESATPGTFTLLKGQQGGKVNRSTSDIDLSTKDNQGYGSSAPGLKTWSIDLTLLPDLPDTLGYTRLESLCNANPLLPFNIQIRKGGQAGAVGDVVFAGSVYGNLDSTDFGQNSGVPVAVKLSGNGAPVTDTYAV